MFLYVFSNLKATVGLDTLYSNQPLSQDAEETLISNESKFELGFFSLGDSTNSYVGIWYYGIPGDKTIVWVANRRPIPQFHRSYISIEAGILCVHSYDRRNPESDFFIWTANSTYANATKAVLHDNGNLVLSDGLSVIWQSFDYPTDTWLPGAKLGNIRSSILTCWKSPGDPAPGIYSFGMEMDPRGSPELFIWKNSIQILWRSGVWNGSDFFSLSNGQRNFSYVKNEQAKYFTYHISTSLTSRYVMTNKGRINQFVRTKNQNWKLIGFIPADSCYSFGFCGPNGVCNMHSIPPCRCLDGFITRSPQQWQSANFSGGCIRNHPLPCPKNDFLNTSILSMPASSQPLDTETDQICRFNCLSNCSCNAYAFNAGKCSLWKGDLLDLHEIVGGRKSQGNLYIRISPHKKLSNVLLAVFITIPLLICILLAYILWRVWRRKHNKKEAGETGENLLHLNLEISSRQNRDSDSITTSSPLGGENKVSNLPHFSFSSISAATDNFSCANKLGEGGFGPVYKGNLFGGKSVAVKRLSERSGQGLEELRNEIVLIARLQHRNLVRLLGCCIDQDEKILIYEYMSNKSLDHFIFDPSKQGLLDWRRRVHIIDGITQGLLYLHQHSRLRIVHRDLKAGNILLDDELNPKISDFGMARIFGGNELQANTSRIVGTYGYMSPEYAMEGSFSIKSDVFAFGVLLLEIISGKKNTGFRDSGCVSLLGYAWELWKADRILELVDSNLSIPSPFVPVRFIHVGFLCVQESPGDRPTMSDVLNMFSNEHIQLVSPKPPAFTSGGSLGSEIDKASSFSVNYLTASMMDGR
ncbi:G-type lectin S-receptor-like serine/threonine-protein kinase At4g27290 [Apium graveolens]|uniref:G-type lectin S-receptor-like serine/threonine-protein kinase At4g27290 n=1 Tax=Apium graveolens TaxID=4045 RepID=UPI003D7BC6FF